MEPHNIELPRRILIGNGVLDKIPDVCRELKLRDGLVLAGPVTLKIAGQRVAESIGADVSMAGDVTFEDIDNFQRKMGKNKYGFILSVGGGKVIDFGKLLAFRKQVPFFSVPTAPSHDGIASERVSIKGKDQRHSTRGEPPIAIVADIELLKSAPSRLIASGGADVISNYTAVYDWRLAAKNGEYYSEYASALALLSAEIVMHSAELIRSREDRGIRNLMEAIISSGISMSLVGTSRPASGSEHLFSHALDMLGSKGLHGEQCGIGSIISACMQKQDWKRIKQVLHTIGAPTTARELGIGDDVIIEALIKAKSVTERYTIMSELDMTREYAEEVCRKTGVIG